MEFGASTSCYYPLPTEEAIQKITDGGFAYTEIFFNTYSELTPGFVQGLSNVAKAGGTRVVSVHPFTSFAETHCLFGNYERRADDFYELYKRYFETCNLLGAGIVVIHGALLRGKTFIPEERYMERYSRLVQFGKQFGVTVAQENVNMHFSENPSFLHKMKMCLGDDFKLVFDVKQAVRSGFDPFLFVRDFGEDIVHIHISDHDGEKDCMPPGRGAFDFKRLTDEMAEAQYTGKYMIEIYCDDYNVERELAKSKRFLSELK